MRSMKYSYGFPLSFFWGHIAVVIFMARDGFEMAFLSKHIVDLVFSPSQAAMVRWFGCLGVALPRSPSFTSR